jgi:long-subunit fatty acid transport protein
VAVRGGAEYRLASVWVLRGGAFVDPSPAPAEHLAPSSPDSTRLGVSAGASRRFGDAWSGDLFYEYLHLLGRETANMDAIQARYGGHAQMLGIGVRYRR